jgi:hypothetical protein
MAQQDGQARSTEPAAVQIDGVIRGRWERRRAGTAGPPAVQARDLPKKVVRVPDLIEDGATLGRPLRRRTVVGLEAGSEIAEMAVKASPLPRVERGPSNGVDSGKRWHRTLPADMRERTLEGWRI